MDLNLIDSLIHYTQVKEVLFKYPRSQIFEVYFARLDGRSCTSEDDEELYKIPMDDLKLFLAGRLQADPLLQQIARINLLASESRPTSL